MLLRRLVPGALVPTTPPHFAVINTALLGLLRRWMTEVRDGVGVDGDSGAANHHGANDATSSHATTATKSSPFTFASQWVAAHEGKLLTHQQNAVDAILARDSNGAAGHLVVMDTGLGKTLTAATALLKLLSQSAKYQHQVDFVIWATVSYTHLTLPTKRIV